MLKPIKCLEECESYGRTVNVFKQALLAFACVSLKRSSYALSQGQRVSMRNISA
jgi:hypothetical protein